MAQPTLIILHPNEFIQGLYYYPFPVNLDRCIGNCNTLNDLSNRICVLSKTEDVNVSVFNMITGINESKTLTKHHTIMNVNSIVEIVIEIKIRRVQKYERTLCVPKRLYLESCQMYL